MPDNDLQAIQAARDLVEAAHRAQAAVAGFDQAKIDAICEAMATAAQAHSMRLATLASPTGRRLTPFRRQRTQGFSPRRPRFATPEGSADGRRGARHRVGGRD